ncbi:MAG: recombination factor protein RarA, partial [Gammaproteobacteria bacterium]|nr:recombination factor protein RarA [Gammaproteobacteria bacterium]
DAFAAGETYFPEAMGEKEYYQPVDRGLEAKIKLKLDHLRALNKADE